MRKETIITVGSIFVLWLSRTHILQPVYRDHHPTYDFLMDAAFSIHLVILSLPYAGFDAQALE